MKKIFLITLFFAFALGAQAQDGVINFNEEVFDFGAIDEGVKATHEFVFVNTGTTPVTINHVQPGCGCTTPDWPEEPIPPGGTSKITATFDSEGRPGVFNKSITISSDATESMKTIYIKGIVIKKEEDSVAPTADQLKKSPAITLSNEKHDFGKLARAEKTSVKVQVKNTGKTPLTISDIKAACGCVSFKLNGESIPPKKTAELEIFYTPYFEGKNIDKVTIFTNDLKKPRITFTLSADVFEAE
ncbi:MAG: DUF1573 domain-containing protein [Cytophagaceae bacterium]